MILTNFGQTQSPFTNDYLVEKSKKKIKVQTAINPQYKEQWKLDERPSNISPILEKKVL
jgi:hypothetical protein